MGRHKLKLLLSMIASVAISSIGNAGEAPDLSGAELYQTFCSSCHGDSAHGDGPVASMFKIAVPDLTAIAMRHFGEFPTAEVHRVIDGRRIVGAHGSREMPVWGREFYAYDGADPIRRQRANEMIARLVEYLRSIQVAEFKQPR